jgi:hypothetical protein
LIIKSSPISENFQKNKKKKKKKKKKYAQHYFHFKCFSNDKKLFRMMLLHFDLVLMYKAIHALYLFDRNKAAIINAMSYTNYSTGHIY